VICSRKDDRFSSVICTTCNRFFHKKHVFDFLGNSFQNWTCNFCLFPFVDEDLDATQPHQHTPTPLPTVNHFDQTIQIGRGLRAGHINIRSLRRNYHELTNLINFYKFDLFFVSETFLNSDTFDHEISIEHYKLLRKDRLRTGGGLVVYIREEINFEIPDTAYVFDDKEEFECLNVTIKLPCTKPIVYACIYRPPSSNFNTFLNNLSEYCQSISSLAPELFILGDLNIDYLNDLRKPAYDNCLKAANLKQLIQTPTRITLNTLTLLDHILSNSMHINRSGVITCGMSDHDVIYVVRKRFKPKVAPRTYFGRCYKHLDVNQLESELANLPWGLLDSVDCSEDLLDTIRKLVLPIVDKKFPARKKSIKAHKSPWMSHELVKCIQMRNRLKSNFIKTKDPVQWTLYKKGRNLVNKLICDAKREYFHDKFCNAQTSNDVWKAYFELSNKHVGSSQIHELYDNGICIREMDDIANSLRNAFVCQLSSSLYAYGSPNYDNTDYVPVSETTVKRVILSTKHNVSSSVHCIPPKILKLNLEPLTTAITKLFNFILRTGDFPNEWKTAVITPILKPNKDPKSPKSYRPISILPYLSKVLEKVIHTHLYEALKPKLSAQQFGFQFQLSTLHTLSTYTQFVYNKLDESRVVSSLFLDLTQAFDKVCHFKLLDKLKTQFNIPHYLQLLLCNYLKDRNFFIKINGLLSQRFPLPAGVPQGSCLGPLLFIAYFNDVNNTNISYLSNVTIYADDICCTVEGPDIETNLQKLVECACEVNNWCHLNGMEINFSKTKYLFYKFPHTKCNLDLVPSKLLIDGKYIDRVHDFSYLGVIMDEFLNFNRHAATVIGKVTRRLNNLKFHKRILPPKSMKIVFPAVINSVIEYGIPIYCTDPYKLNILDVKISKFCDEYYKHSPFHTKLSFPTAAGTYKYQTLTFLKSLLTSTSTPLLLSNMLTKRPCLRASKFALNLTLPKFKKTAFRNSFIYRAVQLWNELPQEIQQLKLHKEFKENTKILFK